MTALDGVLVWIDGNTLMQRAADGTIGPVMGAPTGSYRAIDLGRAAGGALVLTSLRCSAANSCQASSDDLNGHRTAFTKLVPKRCALTAAPSRWQDRVAYGLSCSKLKGKPGVHDAKRSGLFVRKGAGAAKRLKQPKGAGDNIIQVDLTGTNVGAAALHRGADLRFPGTYTVYAQTINGTKLRSRRDSDSGDEGAPRIVSILGMALGTDARLWTLTGWVDGDGTAVPNAATTSWLGSSCADVLSNAPTPNAGQDSYPAESIAVDGARIYLYVPGTGIVTHPFAPTSAC